MWLSKEDLRNDNTSSHVNKDMEKSHKARFQMKSYRQCS